MDVAHGDSDAMELAESVLRVMEEIDVFAAVGIRVGASIGIACCAPAPGEKANPDELLKQADLAMYEAKRAGKGCYRIAEMR
jgi:diguanylate cyclase (GGDEF)-like protein